MRLKDIFRKKEEPILKTENATENENVDVVNEPIPESEEKKEEPKSKEEIYNDLQKKYTELVKSYSVLWNDCAYRGLPYNEMLTETENLRNEIYEISQNMRLIKEPRITYTKKNEKTVGDRYKIADFIDMCVDGVLTDEDGFGLYASSKGISDIEVYPSDITGEKYRKDFTHVMWFNK